MSTFHWDMVKLTPPVGVAALSSYGFTVPEAIQFFTLIYAIGLVVQQGYRLWRWFSGWRKARGSH